MFDDLLERVTALKSQSNPFVLATVVGCKPPTSAKPGAKAIVQADGSFHGWVGGSCAQPLVIQEALKALQDGQTRVMLLSPNPEEVDMGLENFVAITMTCQSEGTLAIYLEPFLPKPQLLIFGASPMARSLVSQGNTLGFRVCACDPTASIELFPNADVLVQDLSAIQEIIGAKVYVVVATMGHYDEEALASVVGSQAGYIGLVSSPRRGRAVVDYLAGKGVSSEALNKVKFPAGLDIGAQTPEEIALSILSEIVQNMRSEEQGIVLEAVAQKATDAIDPICKMTVGIADARYLSTRNAETFYFCCLRCKDEFDREAERSSLQPVE